MAPHETTPLPATSDRNHGSGSTVEAEQVDAARVDKAWASAFPSYARKDVLRKYIPSTDPSDPSAQTLLTRMSKQKHMLRLQLGLSGLVVAVNTALVIGLWTAYPPVNGTGDLFTGDCTLVAFLNSGSHVLVNILSTGVLGAGNYCMQVLLAPSRADIDRAHAAGTSLAIGKQSIANARHVSPTRSGMWVALAIVSTILHLM